MADSFSSQIEHIYSISAKYSPTGKLAGPDMDRANLFVAGNPVAKFIFVILSIGLAVGLSFVTPPPTKICGTLHGPPVTTSRLRFPDGRPVAFAETGVSKDDAVHKIVIVHDFGGSRLDLLPCSKKTLEEYRVYMVSFDRAGYGESHPFPHRSIASEAHDIENLADALELGPKFYVIAIGVGAYAGWGCLEHIPHRISGMAMISPVANFWWPGSGLASSEAFETLEAPERYTLRVAHHAPRLLYHYTSQNWLPSSSMEKLSQISKLAIQQGAHESIHKDLMIQFGTWELNPGKLESFSANGSVDIWQSSKDPFFPPSLQEWVKRMLPWAQFHRLPGDDRNSWLELTRLSDNILVRMLSSNQTHV